MDGSILARLLPEAEVMEGVETEVEAQAPPPPKQGTINPNHAERTFADLMAVTASVTTIIKLMWRTNFEMSVGDEVCNDIAIFNTMVRHCS